MGHKQSRGLTSLASIVSLPYECVEFTCKGLATLITTFLCDQYYSVVAVMYTATVKLNIIITTCTPYLCSVTNIKTYYVLFLSPCIELLNAHWSAEGKLLALSQVKLTIGEGTVKYIQVPGR